MTAAAAMPIRVLTFSSLFPNAIQPNHGIFVANRLRELMRSGLVVGDVVAPVPHVARMLPLATRYRRYRQIQERETWEGRRVLHPRYIHVPGLSHALQPWLMFRAGLMAYRQLIADGAGFDVIDAHYFYPDGVAACLLGRAVGKPVVITARGTDLNVLPNFRLPRRMVRWAAEQAAAVITVSAALEHRLLEIGAMPRRLDVLRNGVDLTRFRPDEGREELRRSLGIRGPLVLSVGNLVESKGHHIVMMAVRRLPEVGLFIVGDGPDRQRLVRLAATLGLGSRVRFLGDIPNVQLPRLYNAADVLALASSREGMPNVVLEAMACGTPVVATDVGGIPEVVQPPLVGRLITRRAPHAFAEAILSVLAQASMRSQIRAYAEQFSWKATTDQQVALFTEILGHLEISAPPPLPMAAIEAVG
jgi:teichuronic acid biosynthesis glycosyltransferase TuaC